MIITPLSSYIPIPWSCARGLAKPALRGYITVALSWSSYHYLPKIYKKPICHNNPRSSHLQRAWQKWLCPQEEIKWISKYHYLPTIYHDTNMIYHDTLYPSPVPGLGKTGSFSGRGSMIIRIFIATPTCRPLSTMISRLVFKSWFCCE